MIIVKNLHKEFEKNHVLRGIDYHIHQGEKIVIVGPSGSGKSTFLRCLNLLETPSSGEIWFDGQLITDPKTNIDQVRTHMGWYSRTLICFIIFRSWIILLWLP